VYVLQPSLSAQEGLPCLARDTIATTSSLTCRGVVPQLEQLQENYEKKVPLGPHGSVRPNKQTLEDIKKNGKAEIAVKHTDLLPDEQK